MKRCYKNFENIVTFYVNSTSQNINFKLLDFRAFTEYKDNCLIICGIYDLICYFKTTNSDDISSKLFRKSFVCNIELNSLEIKNFDNYEVEVDVIGAPELKISKVKWLDKICNYLSLIPRKIYITIKGAICCEIFKKKLNTEERINITDKKKLLI